MKLITVHHVSDDIKKVIAEYHLSGDALLVLSIITGLVIGGFGGWLLGMSMNNIGLGVTIGVVIGLILGIVGGIILSDRSES